MKILVTGGAGFIGSNLCAKLLNKNNQVTCVDNIRTGNIDNIKPLLENINFYYLHHDITQPLNIETDVIFNLACPTSPAYVKLHPNEVSETCLVGTDNMLQLAIDNDAKLINTSTIRVHEDGDGKNIYTDGKRVSEQIARHHYNTTILRLFSVYGVNMQLNDSRVIPQFIQKAINNEDIIIIGDGSQVDTFAYIDDITDSLIQAIDYPASTYNLGSRNGITIKELAYMIVNLVGSHSKIITNCQPIITIDRTKTLGDDFPFKENISLVEGLEKTINYFRSII